MPPPNETPEERELREAEESRARMRSEELDEIIRKDGIERKKSKAEVNVLLLGQSESGKSTTLKRTYYFLFYFSFNYSDFAKLKVILVTIR